MVLFFTILLAISIAGMLGLIYVKRYELRTGNMLFAGVRPRLGAFFHEALIWVERILPALARIYGRRAWKAFRVFLHRTIASIILAVEQGLEYTLRALQTRTQPKPGNTQASSFLREVAEHKKKLISRSKNKKE
jgi:hypothetical protein